MTESQKGKIKFYDPNKGYGFIFPEGSKQEIFCAPGMVNR